MRIPLAAIGKVLVIGGSSTALHILPASGQPRESVLFLEIPPGRFLQHYAAAGLLPNASISTNEQFLDVLGDASGGDKAIERLRQIEEIASASRYIKMSRGAIHVYWIQSALPGGSQKVYFAIDGDREMFQLSGNVTPEFLDAVLENLRISDVP